MKDGRDNFGNELAVDDRPCGLYVTAQSVEQD